MTARPSIPRRCFSAAQLVTEERTTEILSRANDLAAALEDNVSIGELLHRDASLRVTHARHVASAEEQKAR